MVLSSLEIHHFRNISHTKIVPSKEINIFYGENGSGKTSLLEAIYHLSLGRSFRTRYFDRVVQYGQERFSVFGDIASVPTGVERSRAGDVRIRINQADVYAASKLAANFPLQLINQDTYQLITAGPKIRRQFLDWGVFHVEHGFLANWKKMRRALKQRNAALRSNSRTAMFWDTEFIEAAYVLDKQRKEYIYRYQPILMKLLSSLLFDSSAKPQIDFYSGWDQSKPLDEILQATLERDGQLGYTQYGAHRADLRIFIDKTPIEDVLSRGQQKLFVCAMRLAQGILLKNEGKNCTFLIDDLPSELDAQRLKLFCTLLSELDAQIFITGIVPQSFEGLFRNRVVNRFHVKHGELIA